MKKTMKQWEKSKLDLEDFLSPLDEIGEEIYREQADVAPPKFHDGTFLQSCDAMHTKGEVYYYMTFAKYANRYYYLGTLPQFEN